MSRRKFDFYETPPHYVQALQDVIGVPTGRLIEPCVGKGAIIDMLKTKRGVWIRNDINKRRDADYHEDMRTPMGWLRASKFFKHGKFDWAITNPPFRRGHMMPIIRCMLRHAHNVAVLARLSVLEPTNDRRLFWRLWAPRCSVIVLPRYSFKRVNGRRTTDSVTCCWLVWQRVPSDAPYRQLYVSGHTEDE